MPYYRLYFMNPRNGHIERFAEFEAPDHEAAAALAAEHEGPQPLELWCRHNKVRRFEPVATPLARSLRAAEQLSIDQLSGASTG